MNSPSESFDEEGEIFETEVEKAPPSLPSVTGPRVDRLSSRNRGSRSPAINNYRGGNDDAYPPSRHDRYDPRDHGRRPGNGDNMRGEKRRRSQERGPDPRQHRVHYEANGDVNVGRRPRVSYADIDRSEHRDSPRPFDQDDRYYRDTKQSRTRSRSPPRGPRGDVRGGRRGYFDDNRRDGGNRLIGRERERDRIRNDSRRHSREQSVSEQGDLPVPSELSKRDAEYRNKQSDQGNGDRQSSSYRTAQNGNGGRSTQTSKSIKFSPEAEIMGHDRNSPAQKAPLKPPPEEMEIEEPVDEARLIEERRKKREAIKAKYRGQATPLLVSALALAGSNPGSPGISEGEVTPAVASPALPDSSREDSPAGAFSISKDGATMINAVSTAIAITEDDGPSAADYDPTVDMQEDNKRYEQHIHDHEVPSSAYDETKATVRDEQTSASLPKQEPQEQSIKKEEDDDFDMFAEGDDDDMFAEMAPKAKKVESQTNKTHPLVSDAKQLDASLLDNWDDPEGYYRVIPAELLDGRYRVQTNLGRGMFSGVIRALDLTTQKLVAIKIIRSNETMKKAGLKEIDILKKLIEADPDDKKHLVRLERSFEHKGHLCLVFENLSINLREVLKRYGRSEGISLMAVRSYAQQMFLGLSLLRKCNILHADLKPDNVLANESCNMLKICDLGSASDASENEITPYLVSRFYRAPEIILGIPYDFAIDMWSIGCTLYELYTGKILFTGRTNNQMLRSIMECRGKFPQKVLRKGKFTGLHFDDMLNFRSVEQDKITGKDITKTLTFNKPTRELRIKLLAATSPGMTDSEMKDLYAFIDLLDRCLNLNPERRCTPVEALKHPFIHRAK
ncbi:kinase-like protein [Choiromyces venosus 120613-1]|uniref:non-specific serine/threonine protein kinase n=1 Tax=Choiromyces venosus 120613-1 TaxID=1336337 RepID=A0A3N4JYA2_9PEZI|nr:kinase-like protein [Choiromyces venosus 120613-1]